MTAGISGITDSTVFSLPSGNASVRRMAIEAGDLGFDSIVAIDQKNTETGDFRVIGGVLIREQQFKPVIRAARASANDQTLLIVNAGDNVFNRSVLQVRGVHILRHLHKTEKNSFDHITARMAADRGIAIDLDVRPLVMTRGGLRQKAIQRYRDILRLMRRFEFPVTVSSNARNPAELKSVRELISLLAMAGMEESEVIEGLKTPGMLLSPKGPVSVVR
ncbi:MAG TPA: RNase P subunit p30 family protein [Methanoregulaceae archaeon]|nr:RNase P subunit p30 family protein [Methanoregulaceae archaeon]